MLKMVDGRQEEHKKQKRAEKEAKEKERQEKLKEKHKKALEGGVAAAPVRWLRRFALPISMFAFCLRRTGFVVDERLLSTEDCRWL